MGLGEDDVVFARRDHVGAPTAVSSGHPRVLSDAEKLYLKRLADPDLRPAPISPVVMNGAISVQDIAGIDWPAGKEYLGIQASAWCEFVPVLTMVLGLDIRRASGTSLLIMVVTSMVSLLQRATTSMSCDLGIVAIFASCSAAGGVLGGPLSQRACLSTLTLLFAVLLAAIALKTLVVFIPA